MWTMFLHFQLQHHFSFLVDQFGLVVLGSVLGFLLWFRVSLHVKKTWTVFVKNFHGR